MAYKLQIIKTGLHVGLYRGQELHKLLYAILPYDIIQVCI